MPRNDLRHGGSSVSRARDGGAVRGRQANPGRDARSIQRGSTRPPDVGERSAPGRSGRYSGPVRSSVTHVPPSRIGGGPPRGQSGGGPPRGFSDGGSRGFGGGFRGSAGGR